ncbi:glycosyltransferase family 9 protein [Rhodanobacter sp. MP7CTX1]|uniref:glycosyltransferase family 9 protein n=1 Tax=Rhodanobacter sp. MP7CTX1 TaxID=2723084 RepID=UPI00160961FE|nr:glycosyltransferase family 9 protein [Rhodanobacter sp. MP7CTX1]MBB6189292.1 ADP-heptose:LPS heptosyltransferase [Rhodanobacter sp. MP7CTX1]
MQSHDSGDTSIHRAAAIAFSDAPPPLAPRPWDDFRRRFIASCFGRLFGTVKRGLCEPGQLPTRGIHRVLICRPNHRLGNAILISPLLAEVEALYPGAEIDLVTGGNAAQNVFTNRFQIRQIFSLPQKIARHLFFTVGLLRQLRRNSYDLAIDACDGSQSGRLLLAMVKARYKLGLPDGLRSGESAWNHLPWPEYFGHRGVFLLRMAYAGKIDRAYPSPNIRLSEQEQQQAGKALAAVLGESVQRSRTQPVVGIFANATGAKRYSAAWWVEFVIALQTLRPDVRIVDLVAEHGQTQLGGNFPSYYTRDLRRLASVIANMDAFISADCGVMHLAVAAGTPTLGLFSVTCAVKYGPCGQTHTAVGTNTLSAAEVARVAAEWLSLP